MEQLASSLYFHLPMQTDSRVLAAPNTISLPQSAPLSRARVLASRVRERGGRAFLVGGFVRDAILQLNPKDADIEVYGLEAEELRRVLSKMGRVNCVGESFRVFKLAWHDEENMRHELDVSLPRRDTKTGEGHRGFEVVGDPNASYEDACRRRDFTINAMLCDPLTGEIIDPFDGFSDLQNRVLRAVDAAHFAEDSLRVLRAAQFAARFELMIDPATVELCRAIDLSDLPRERIWGEWEKLLLKAQRPSIGLRAASELRVLAQLFPYLETALEREATSLCNALDRAANERDNLSPERQITLMMATCGAFLGRGEKDSRDKTNKLLEVFGLKTLNGYDVRAQTLALVKNAMEPAEWFERQDEMRDGDVRRLAGQCEPRLLIRLTRAFDMGEAAAWLEKQMRALQVFDAPPAPLLLGRHLLELGLTPGPRIGEITRAVYEKQLDGDVRVLADALEAAKQIISATEK